MFGISVFCHVRSMLRHLLEVRRLNNVIVNETDDVKHFNNRWTIHNADVSVRFWNQNLDHQTNSLFDLFCCCHQNSWLNINFECIIFKQWHRKKNPESKSKAFAKIWVTERRQTFILALQREFDVRASITRDSIINCYDIVRFICLLNVNTPS